MKLSAAARTLPMFNVTADECLAFLVSDAPNVPSSFGSQLDAARLGVTPTRDATAAASSMVDGLLQRAAVYRALDALAISDLGSKGLLRDIANALERRTGAVVTAVLRAYQRSLRDEEAGLHDIYSLCSLSNATRYPRITETSTKKQILAARKHATDVYVLALEYLGEFLRG